MCDDAAMKCVIRPEQPADEAAIRQINEAAFPTAGEARLVDALRAASRLTISLVATVADSLLGHVAFSPVRIEGVPESAGLGLGPLAVSPTHQRQGIGGQLIEEGLKAAAQAGFSFVVVLGEPRYYSRFGFVTASRFGLTNEYGADEAFMICELHPGGLPDADGLVKYAPEFAEVA